MNPYIVRRLRSVSRVWLFLLSFLPSAFAADPSAQKLELTRTIRTWEFLPVVGTRAGLFGHENGRFEAWVYPLKIFREFHLTFHVGDRALPAESLARTLTVRPESASILYVGDSFRVRETLCVPVNESGAVILLEIETEQPLEVEAAFTGDFQLEWPAALGGTYVNWDAKEHAFVFGEEARKFAALVGSPTGADAHLAYETNYSASEENSLRLGVTQKGKERKALVIAASVTGAADATKTYEHLLASYTDSVRESADYYRSYLDKTVSLELPDAALQQAYDWARISTIQGLVNNPYLGTGLVAGYRTSGTSQRPGFAWFFGRDSLWTSFALNAEGDFATTRAALSFLSKYQREDGKVPHEISQSASLVPWFKDYPYPYVSADATPLFIIAMNDYAVQSGDVAFAREKWDNVWRAYQFLRSTYDSNGFAQNMGIGHGWVEGGPLLPVKNEYYHAGLGVEALRALSNLARLVGKDDIAKQLAADFEKSKPALDQAYWSPETRSYAFALKQDNQRADDLSVLTTVPMWFSLPDANHADETITKLAAEEHQTDWGMRIISRQSKVYDGSGYHYGAVWPLFTGWASVGEYRYHRAFPAYSNLRANALLGADGALGHFTEVLSGDYYQSFATSSPHQIWSAAMVISPILRGMFGLQTDVEKRQVTLAPHIPADWTDFAIHNVNAGGVSLDFQYRKTADSLVLETKRKGTGECWLEFSPAFSLHTTVVSVELSGRPVPFKVQPNSNDQHLSVRFPIYGGPNILVVHVKNDFGLTLSNQLPPLGSASRELRVISESWNATKTQLTLEVSGLAGARYALGVWNPAQVSSVEGGALSQPGKLEMQMPAGPSDSYVQSKVILHFGR
ncbi:MAG TPA: amylo-alpha-1,6-glucosidase [Candidatus Dormibacteraeota bacterium]|nr:amylo-alpha-1,6-glucosidase [Candidatus Dormibacteraeota bacterium]